MLLLHSSSANVNGIKHVIFSGSHTGLVGSILWFWLCSQLSLSGLRYDDLALQLSSPVNLLHGLLFLRRSLSLRLYWEPVLIKFDAPTGERSSFADFLQLVNACRLRIPKENAEPGPGCKFSWTSLQPLVQRCMRCAAKGS